jgi:hypothetical protein
MVAAFECVLYGSQFAAPGRIGFSNIETCLTELKNN